MPGWALSYFGLLTIWSFFYAAIGLTVSWWHYVFAAAWGIGTGLGILSSRFSAWRAERRKERVIAEFMRTQEEFERHLEELRRKYRDEGEGNND